MKKLTVVQQLNPGYLGPEHTPDIEAHVYLVTQVINSTEPPVHDTLTKAEVNEYAESKDWIVTIK